MKRIFAAIKITPDENFLNVYYQLVKSLKQEGIKWVKPENFHLTLKFFGEIPDDRIDIICDELDDITLSSGPFNINIRKTGVFGSRYNPKVIWFGIEDNGHLAELAEKVLSGMDKTGFTRDRQNFVPHLTVGRIRKLTDKERFHRVIKKFAEAELMKTHVGEIYLYESHLKPRGPVYEILEKFSL